MQPKLCLHTLLLLLSLHLTFGVWGEQRVNLCLDCIMRVCVGVHGLEFKFTEM